MSHTLTLRADGFGRGIIMLDDLDISDSVSSVKLESTVNKVSVVIITFQALDLDVEAEVVDEEVPQPADKS